MAYPFLPFCAVCQKQIVIPNNSLLYCSEKCKREDALSSSPPLHINRSQSISGSSSSSSKFTSLEPSRKEKWGIQSSPAGESSQLTTQSDSPSPSSGSSPSLRLNLCRASSRPLPPLHPRSLGSSPRTMDLVLPFYRGTGSSSPPSNMEQKDLEYGRRTVEGNAVSTGGLKQLFNFKEPQSSIEN